MRGQTTTTPPEPSDGTVDPRRHVGQIPVSITREGAPAEAQAVVELLDKMGAKYVGYPSVQFRD